MYQESEICIKNISIYIEKIGLSDYTLILIGKRSFTDKYYFIDNHQ